MFMVPPSLPVEQILERLPGPSHFFLNHISTLQFGFYNVPLEIHDFHDFWSFSLESDHTYLISARHSRILRILIHPKLPIKN